MNNPEKKQNATPETGQRSQPEHQKMSRNDHESPETNPDDLDKIEGRMDNGELGGGLKKEEESSR